MNEVEWCFSDNARALVEHLRNHNAAPRRNPPSDIEARWLVRERKWRLIGTACCARLRHLLPQAALELLEASWAYADGALDTVTFAMRWNLTSALLPGLLRRQFQSRCTDWAIQAVIHLGPECDVRALLEDAHRALVAETSESGAAEELAIQSQIVRCAIGNPFVPVRFDPAWATDTATTLARQMYDSREFSAMPILADALQDAGCENAELLNHCRDPHATHVRGCWVCDLVLAKV